MFFLSKKKLVNFLFSGWSTISNILFVGTLIYLSLVLVLRLFGKRALAKMNAFDFVVTVALGSLLSTTVVNKNTKFIDGILAMILLLSLQFILSKFAWYSSFINKLIKDEPVILFYQNEFDYTAMKKQRILEKEIYQAVRSRGFSSMDNVLAVVLETTGDISVLPNNEEFSQTQNSTLQNLSLKSFHGKGIEEKQSNLE